MVVSLSSGDEQLLIATFALFVGVVCGASRSLEVRSAGH
jgi:hypothetical protein